MSKNQDQLEAHAKAQLSRLAHLQGFPKEREAIRDYIVALCVVRTPQAITALMDDVVGDSISRCVTAAEMRRMAYERVEKKAPVDNPITYGPFCSKCHGFGVTETTNASDLRSMASFCDCRAGRNREQNSCRCPERADGKCTRSIERAECACPPWIINMARMKLSRLDANSPAGKVARELAAKRDLA